VTNALIDQLRQGSSDEEAIAGVLGVTFETFKKDWLRYLRARSSRSLAVAEPPRLEFKKGKRQSDDEDRDDEVDQGASPEIRRWARLGNLLRKAGRPRAAAMEYERAVARAGLHAPMLHNRLASAYLEAGDDARALSTLKVVEGAFPDYGQTHIQLGRVYYKRGDWESAQAAYLAANRQNPFNPEIHAALADIYARLGQDAPAQREAHAFALLNHPDEELGSTLADDNDVGAALLTLETRPFAQLVIDDVDVGLMTPVETRLKPGHHVLRVRNPALAIDRTLPIDLRPGEHARIRLDLTEP
jgi:tetratricopeptide (TPR) repeat protein